MSNYTYTVVPFIGKIKSNESAVEVSNQLQNIINTKAENGWELHQLSEVNIEVKPGCLAGLFGAKETYVKFDQIIFKKPA